MANHEKLTQIFREIMEDESLVLRRDLKADQVEKWDSFNHMNLMIMIEEEFGVTVDPTDVDKMRNVGDLVDILNAKGCEIAL